MLSIPTLVAKNATLPSYAHQGDAGMDLYATQSVTLKSLERGLVPTGIRMAIPQGYEGQVRPKSGLAIKHGISVLNTPGTIDAGYRGEINVIAINLSNEEFTLAAGTKVAQLVITKIEQATLAQVDTLDATTRGEGGFGSTGR